MQRTRVWTTRHLILIVLAVGVLWLFAGLIAGPARTLRGWEARPDLQVDLSARPEGEVVAAARLKPFQFLLGATAETMEAVGRRDVNHRSGRGFSRGPALDASGRERRTWARQKPG